MDTEKRKKKMIIHKKSHKNLITTLNGGKYWEKLDYHSAAPDWLIIVMKNKSESRVTHLDFRLGARNGLLII